MYSGDQFFAPQSIYSAFTSIVPVLSSTPYLFLTYFSKNGQKHEKWEEIDILTFEETFQNMEKNKFGGFRDFDPKIQFWELFDFLTKQLTKFQHFYGLIDCFEVF